MKVLHSAAAVAVLLVLAGGIMVVVRLTAAQSVTTSLGPEVSAPVVAPSSVAPGASAAPLDPAPPATSPQAAPHPGETHLTEQRTPAPEVAPTRRHTEQDRADAGLPPEERKARDEARRAAADAVCDRLGLPRSRCEDDAVDEDY